RSGQDNHVRALQANGSCHGLGVGIGCDGRDAGRSFTTSRPRANRGHPDGHLAPKRFASSQLPVVSCPRPRHTAGIILATRRTPMLYRRFVWPTLAGFVLSLGRPLAADTAQLAVDPSMRFQTIEGFGSAIGSHDASPTSNVNFGSPRYTQFAHDFSQDLGASMVRVEVNPDALPVMPAGGLTGNLGTDVPLLNFQEIDVRVGGNAAATFNQQKIDRFRVFGSVWTPPAWMKANNSNGARLQPD